jgi:hypothetical protein
MKMFKNMSEERKETFKNTFAFSIVFIVIGVWIYLLIDLENGIKSEGVAEEKIAEMKELKRVKMMESVVAEKLGVPVQEILMDFDSEYDDLENDIFYEFETSKGKYKVLFDGKVIEKYIPIKED